MATQSPQRPEHARSKSSSFSFRSNKSDKSDGKSPKSPKSPKAKIDLRETAQDKQRFKLGNTKVNPNQALREAQPIWRAQNEVVTIQPLRGQQYKDWQGNVITDPDASNPARPRLERPLDTIRSFEAAIEGSNRRKAKLVRSESAGDILTGDSSRRSSTYGTDVNVNPRSVAPLTNAYHQQQPSRRPGSQQGQYYDQYGRGGPPGAYGKRAGMGSRTATAPASGYSNQRQYYQEEYNGYGQQQPQHGYYESVDTTADSSGNSEPWTNSTDPSSENSSIDRINGVGRHPNDVDAYGGYQGQRGRGSPVKGQTSHPIAEEEWQGQENGHQATYGQAVSSSAAGPYTFPSSGERQYQQQPQHASSASLSYPFPNGENSRPPAPPSHGVPQHQASYSIPAGTAAGPSSYSQGRPNPYHDPARNALRKQQQQQSQPPSDKRKSWLRRTFSRSNN